MTAHLSLTGLVTAAAPLGGTAMSIEPGDTVVFRPATVPALDRLGLSTLLGYGITLDAAGLPGGGAHVLLRGAATYRITFPKAGLYTVHWRATSLLGGLALNLNELKGLGVDLNAALEWTAQIVVGEPPLKPALSLALPAISLQPDLLSTINVPKITIPQIVLNPAEVRYTPPVNSSSPTAPGGSSGNSGSNSGSGAPTPAASPSATASSGNGVTFAQPTEPSAQGEPTSTGTAPPLGSGPGKVSQNLFDHASLSDYAFDAVAGFLILGLLWLIWIASIRPILGR